MDRREFLKTTALATVALSLGQCTAPTIKPNLILLLADDLGYGDLSCYGGRAIDTPHIDKLAARGMRFTNFYAASAVCSPTRASCLTGCYPQRFGIIRHFDDQEMHLPPGTVTLPKLLKQKRLFDQTYREMAPGRAECQAYAKSCRQHSWPITAWF